MPLPDLTNDAEMARQGRLSILNRERRRIASELQTAVVDTLNQARQDRSAGHRDRIRKLLDELGGIDDRLMDL